MSKATWLVNAGCCALLLWGGFTFSKNWKAFGAEHQVSLLKNSPDRGVVKGAPVSPAPVTQAWTDIFSRNPFSFDRNDIDIAPVAPPAPRVAAPKPVLFGVVDLGNGKGPVAMLGAPGARISSQSVKVGEQFKGWTVVKIDKRAVVVENDGVEESIVMGLVPIDLDAAKTPMTPSTPSVSSTFTPPTAAATPSTSAQASPGVAPSGTVMTPFGPQPVKQ